MMVEPNHPEIPVARQCELIGLSRSTLYYRPRGDDALNERLMRMIDRQYLDRPSTGVEMMTAWLNRQLAEQGVTVNIKRVRRLMRLMGLEAVYPKPRDRGLSLQNKANAVYPYLLKDVTIDRPDQVWCTDITYVPMRRGWVYLAAIMDWFSRYVLSWEVSVTLDATFCVCALERALGLSSDRRPEIFNSDQGGQFTSRSFTGVLKEAGVSISMDGRGRVFDNIFIERLWRSVKYEEVYLRDYQTVAEAVSSLSGYFAYYNHERPHRSLDYRTPAEAYGAEVKHGTVPRPWGGVQTSTAAEPLALRARVSAAATTRTRSP